MSQLAKNVSFGIRTVREIHTLLRAALWALVDFVYPNACLVCGRGLGDPAERVCGACLSRIAAKATQLGSLAAADPYGKEIHYLAVWEYEEPLPTLIHALKYGGMWKLAPQLSREMARQIRAHERFAAADSLVPVPLHRLRRRERGFNQSEKLAEGISKVTGQALFPALERARYTRTQTTLSAEERRNNVEGAFRVRKGVAACGRSVLLVDDVLTTGATVRECARVLWQAGAAEVSVVVAARP